MILVGIDDTDVVDSAGTNQLARRLAHELAADWQMELITRHQLLEDPRVPCTSKNGCAALRLVARREAEIAVLGERIARRIRAWRPEGSDPGLCIAAAPAPAAVVAFGRRCQRELVTQSAARQLAAEQGIYLQGLGGSEDGVIGALAAIGLVTAAEDGRVISCGASPVDYYDLGGVMSVGQLWAHGVAEVRALVDDRPLGSGGPLDSGGPLASAGPLTSGEVDVGRRLRPNLRAGRIVLFVAPPRATGAPWTAVRAL